jgi:hypothetical protein
LSFLLLVEEELPNIKDRFESTQGKICNLKMTIDNLKKILKFKIYFYLFNISDGFVYLTSAGTWVCCVCLLMDR